MLKFQIKGLCQDEHSRFISIKNSKILGFKTAVILGQTARYRVAGLTNSAIMYLWT